MSYFNTRIEFSKDILRPASGLNPLARMDCFHNINFIALLIICICNKYKNLSSKFN